MYSPAFVEFLGTSLLIGAVSFTRNHAMIVAALQQIFERCDEIAANGAAQAAR